MASFGRASEAKLKMAHPDIQLVMRKAIKVIDFTIVQTVRTSAEHARYLILGKTTVAYEDSKHSLKPPEGIDIAPWFIVKPHVRWEDSGTFIYTAGIIMGVGYELGIPLRWGGNWDRDEEILTDQNFDDVGHFELDRR